MNRQGAKNAKEEPGSEVDDWAQKVIGAAIEVHRILGPGFLESVYEESLAIEMAARNIPFERQKPISVSYRGRSVGEGRLDFVVDGKLVIELKAVTLISEIHTAQLMSYLKVTGAQLGLLINFNVPLLKQGLRRIVLT